MTSSKIVTNVSKKPKLKIGCKMQAENYSAVLLLDRTLKKCSIVLNNEKAGDGAYSFTYATISQYRKIIDSSFSSSCEELKIPQNFSSVRLKQTFLEKTLEGDARFQASLTVRIFNEDFSLLSHDSHTVDYLIPKNTFEFMDRSSNKISTVMQAQGSKTTYLERYGLKRLLSCGNESEERSLEEEIARDSFKKSPEQKRAVFNKSTEVSSEKVKQWIDLVSRGQFVPKEDFPTMMKFLDRDGVDLKKLDNITAKEKLSKIEIELRRIYDGNK